MSFRRNLIFCASKSKSKKKETRKFFFKKKNSLTLNCFMFHVLRFSFHMTILNLHDVSFYSHIKYRVNLKCLYFIELLGSLRPGTIWESNIFLWYALLASYTVSYYTKYAFHKIIFNYIIVISSILQSVYRLANMTLVTVNIDRFKFIFIWIATSHHITISLGSFNNIDIIFEYSRTPYHPQTQSTLYVYAWLCLHFGCSLPFFGIFVLL